MLERNDPHAHYYPWSRTPRLLSAHVFHEEMLRPASRFRSPLSLHERVRFRISEMLSKLLLTKKLPLYLDASTPLNWQIILNFLYREGILESPQLSAYRFRNDRPKKSIIALRRHYEAARTDAREHVFYGYGSAADFDEAISKAIGELLERYFGTIYKREEMLLASVARMRASGRRFLSLEACSSFEPWQRERFLELQFSDTTVFRWQLADEIVRGRKTYVPAQLMYWMYNWREEKEPLLIPMTSNGSAGHFTREEAIIAAVHEYVQRDGFLIYWMNTLSPRVIDVTQANEPEIQTLLSRLKRYRLTPYFLNVTTDLGIPTTICMLVHDAEGEPFLSIGAATGRTAKDAIMSSYHEALAVQNGASEQPAHDGISFDDYEPFTRDDIGMEERTKMWRGKEMFARARFFISGEVQSFTSFAESFPQYRNPREEFDALIELFRSRGAGYEIYTCEASHHALSKLGYHVVRVFIPALVPMHLQERYPALARSRLTEVPKKLGFEKPVRNIYPHPFP